MSAAVALRRQDPEPRQQPRLFALPGGRAEREAGTLDAALTGAWNELRAGRAAACPICSGSVRPRWSAGAGAVGGRCDDCGSTID